MIVSITVRDSFDDPKVHYPTSATLTTNLGTLALSSCGPLSRTGVTDTSGAVRFTFSQLGGRGSLEVRVTTYTLIELAHVPINFTSPDLDANGTVNVVDLGLWAGGLPPGYLQSSDYDCSHAVNIIDLGVWAGGLGLGCGSAPAKARE
jgi:hypothetical protein